MMSPAARDGAAPLAPAKRRKRRISATGRKAIAEAQRKRWEAKETASGPATASRKKLSAGRVAAKRAALAKKRTAVTS